MLDGSKADCDNSGNDGVTNVNDRPTDDDDNEEVQNPAEADEAIVEATGLCIKSRGIRIWSLFPSEMRKPLNGTRHSEKSIKIKILFKSISSFKLIILNLLTTKLREMKW